MPAQDRRFQDMLREAFDRKSIDRGNAYYLQERVTDVRIEAHGEEIEIEGRVAGSAARPYSVTVDVYAPGGMLTVVQCGCSCPLGGWCKHGVAVLMDAAEALPDVAGAMSPGMAERALLPWQQWLTQVSAPTGNTPPDSRQWRLGFIFDAGTGGLLPPLVTRPVVLSRLKNGGWGKPEPLLRGAYGLQPLTILARLDETQYALIASLRMQSQGYCAQGETFRFDGRDGERLLETLLETQACFWQKPRAGEIGIGAPRSLQWHWESDDAGLHHLRPHSDGTGAPKHWLRTGNRLWYYDPDSRQLGPAGLDAGLAEQLLAAPPLHPAHAAHVGSVWRALPALADIPAPPMPENPPRTVTCTPVPVLTLALPSSAANRAYERHVVPAHLDPDFLAHLNFHYRDVRVAAVGAVVEQRLVDGELLLVQRDSAAETRARQALSEHGLLPADTHPRVHWGSRELFQPGDYLPRDPRQWHDARALLALHAPLVAAGFRIELADDFPIDLLPEPDTWYGDVDDSAGHEWFDLDLGIEVGGERVPLLPILQRALADRRLSLQPADGETTDAVWLAPIDERRHVPLPLARVRTLLQPLLEWMPACKGDTVRVPRLATDVLTDLRGTGLPMHSDASAEAFARRLREAGRTRKARAPAGLRAVPRPYQLEGLRWLSFLREAGLGGVLADDMGLGKTLQILMHLLAEKHDGRLDHPALVVCPTSVVGNWRDQARRHAPTLRVLVLHGKDRAADYDRIAEHDLVITTYALLPRDREALLDQQFALIVFDEAQAIKNPAAKAAQVARQIPAGRRLAVTGTPLENHLGELWAQLDCVLPGLLGGRDHFNRHYRTPIEKHGDAERQARLNRRIAPFVLRRSKEAVAPELPPKTVIEKAVDLDGRQRDLYETLRLAMHDKVRAALARRGLAQSNIVVLDALLKLRQVCCDPRLVTLPGAAGTKAHKAASAKLTALLPMLAELIGEGRRILLFSQFTRMLDLIAAELEREDIAFVRLDGRTRDRDTPIARFQAGEVPLFLISLKAGGTGLNLTAADTVIHYDPWWNPAAESQATDRAHRIGQDKPVFVYKLLCSGTVEEKIQSLQARKASLARAVLEGGTRTGLKFSEEDITDLFGPA